MRPLLFLFVTGNTFCLAQIQYSITDLGTLGCTNNSNCTVFGLAINSFGQVAGQADLANRTGIHAFRWSPGSGMMDLGALYNGASDPQAINDYGQVVGFNNSTNEGTHAFLYTPGVGMIDLAPSIGGIVAKGINNLGAVALERNSTTSYFYTPAGGFQDIGLLAGSSPFAVAINNSNQIAGFTNALSSTGRRAFVWSPAAGMQDLGFEVGGVNGMNDVGQVVGRLPSQSNTGHAFLYAPGSGVRDLGTLPGDTSSTALAINKAGVVVGMSQAPPPSSTTRAFIWTPAVGMVDLNTLIPASSGWRSLRSANGINNNGQITGYGTIQDFETSSPR